MSRIPALIALAAIVGSAPAQRPPSRSEINKLIKAYFEADGRTAEGHARRLEILETIDRVPPLRPRDVKTWKKALMKQQKRGRKLEKNGRNWWWEKEERGLYIVGGENKRPKGLLIGMHGGGRGSGDAGSSHGSYSTAANKLDWVGIFPQVLVQSEHGWTDNDTDMFVLDLVDAALRTWKIDPDKVFFAGHSMGGYGSWTLGAYHADRVAAVVPSAGAPTPYLKRDGTVDGIVEGIIPNLRNVSVLIFQSTDDPKVRPEPNRMAVKLLEEAKAKVGGYDYEYWEVGDRGHSMPRGGALALLEKIVDRVRNPVPDRVTWQPTVRWKRQFYWLYWENLYTQARVDAQLDRENNTIRVTCDHPRKGISVLLDERMVDMTEEVVVVLNDKEVFRGVPEARLSTLLLTSEHPDEKLVFAARVPLVGDS